MKDELSNPWQCVSDGQRQRIHDGNSPLRTTVHGFREVRQIRYLDVEGQDIDVRLLSI